MDLPKSNQARTIALPPPARDVLLRQPTRSGGLVFLSTRGERMSQPSLSGYWSQVRARVALDFDFYLATKHYGVHLLYRLGPSSRAIGAQTEGSWRRRGGAITSCSAAALSRAARRHRGEPQRLGDEELLPLLRIEADEFKHLRDSWAFNERDTRGADPQIFAGGFTAGLVFGLIAGRLEPTIPTHSRRSEPPDPAPERI